MSTVVYIRPKPDGFEVIAKGHRRGSVVSSMPAAHAAARRRIEAGDGEGVVQKLNAAGKVVSEDVYSHDPPHDRSECPGCCVERGSDDQRED